ncbi:MAG: hypothetical protein CMI18_10335 [Opitutaceae bacterium]|nr:hypothetical protein [Opitutaceae bacterium]
MKEVLQQTKDGLKLDWGLLLEGFPHWINRHIFVTFVVDETSPLYPVLRDYIFDRRAPVNFSTIS